MQESFQCPLHVVSFDACMALTEVNDVHFYMEAKLDQDSKIETTYHMLSPPPPL